MDLSIFKAKLAATAQHLTDAGREAEIIGAPAEAATLRQLSGAARGVDELIRLCKGEVPIALRDCPACANTVRAAATRCGYCWRPLTPVSP